MTLEQRAVHLLEQVARWIEDLPHSDWEQAPRPRGGDAIVQSIIDQFKEEIQHERERCAVVADSFKEEKNRVVGGIMAHYIAKAIRG